MSRRGDNIRKRKDGRWEGRYIKQRDENGKAKYTSVYGKSYAEVKEKLLLISTVSESTVKPKQMMFSTALEMWLENEKIKIKESSYYKYKYTIDNYILPHLGNLKLDDITVYQINQFLMLMMSSGGKKGQKLSSSYIKTMSIIIVSAYEFSANENYCQPLKNTVFSPPVHKQEIRILNDIEYKTLFKFVSSHSDRTSLGIMLSLCAGLRIGEVCALKWEDIDFEKKLIHINSTVTRNRNAYFIGTPKTISSKRDIPINAFLYNKLKEYSSDTDFVISDNKNFVNPRTFEYRYHRTLDKANINYINFHALRHTFATKCVEIGMDVKSLSELLGHSNSAITLNTYVHPSMEQKQSYLNMLYA